MLDWKQEIRSRIADRRIDPAREGSMIEELSQHLEDRYRELLSAGDSEPDARERVLGELEGSESFAAALPAGKSRSNRNAMPPATSASGNLFSDLRRDLRFGLRGMIHAPAFSIFAVLTLALGIGASTTVFTVVNTLLLHPLPAHDPSGLVCVYTTDVKNGKQSDNLLPTSYPNLQDLQSRSNVFAGFAGFSPPMVMTMTDATGSERLFGELVSQGYFEALGLAPAKGRFFRPAEIAVAGSAPVAVLSYSAWKTRFNSDPDIVGRTLEINGTPFTVIGVAPQGFLGVSAVFGPDVWLPATMAPQVMSAAMQDLLHERGKPFFQTVARLKPGVSRSQAEASLQTLAAALEREYPDVNNGHTVSVQPVTTALYSGMGGERGMTFASVVLLVIVGLVLLIACSNVANLLLTRSLSRRQEIAVRLAIGASRGRLLRQLLTESLLLGLFGGAVGLGVGYEGCRFLWSFRPPEVARNLADPKLDSTVFLFAFFLSLATGFIFGVLPSLRASKTSLVDSLKEESRIAGMGTRGARSQKVLLVAQMAISLVSLIAASLFLRAIERAYDIDPGFDQKHLAVFLMNPEQTGYDAVRLKAFHLDVRDHVSSLPGVEAVSWASNMPFWSSPSHGVLIEGQRQARKSESLSTVTNTVDVDYFKTMGIPLLQGRAFANSDQEGSLPVAIVNGDLARRYWPDGNALGKNFRLVGDTVARQIVGVVKTSDYTTLGEATQPCIYLPLRQNLGGNFNLYVRTAGDPSHVLEAVQREIKTIAPNVEVSDVRTGTTLINQVLWGARMVLGMLGVFGLLALALASIGLYGILAYSVSGRQHEIGVRMALGASRAAVLRLVVREGMMLVGIGVGIGLAISLLIGRVFSRMLFGLSPADPLSLAGASAVLILVSMLACYLPAMAASRMDPMKALREG
jgi:predicted permease